MTNNTSYGERKYNLLKKLDQLTTSENRIARTKLPMALKVSKRTFERWLYLTKSESLQIPSGKLAILGKFFSCPMEELINYEVPKFSIYSLRRLEQKSNIKLAKSLNLIK